MAVIIVFFLSAAFGGAYLYHCVRKKRLLSAFGAAMLMLIGLGTAAMLLMFAL